MSLVRLLTFRQHVAETIPLGIVLATLFAPVSAQAAISEDELLNLSLEELINIQVTSVSKRPESETEAAAAIYVVTQEDIRRSGATVIPEALRMVPGITVTQAGSHDWTVTARGFNDQYSNKLLVLIDGRTVYSPLFSGVIWDVQDTTLEDIDRIEVIRGPGATLWGANAVNGVINIITKHAKDTQGGYAAVTAGNKITGIGEVRYGAKIGEESYARTYAKYNDYDSQYNLSGGSVGDDWRKRQAGFRSDSKLDESSALTVQGDIYRADENAQFSYPSLALGGVGTSNSMMASGFNLLSRLTHSHSKDSESTLQVYFDNAYRKTAFFNDDVNTFDLDYQHSWTGWDRQEIVWGAGYRYIYDENNPASEQYSLTPSTRSDNLFNAFIQDKFALIPSELFLTLGSKFEHNDYTGVEVQPSVRMSWLPADNQTVWASISRAIHTPSRFTDDGNLSLAIAPAGALLPVPPFDADPVLLANAGNTALDSEELIAYELGYRIQPTKALSLDTALFYNDYSKLFTGTFGTPIDMGPYIYLPVTAQNANEATSYGGEFAAKWNISQVWQMAGSYSYINTVFDDKSGGVGFGFVGKHPKHMFNLRSTYLFDNKLEMTNLLYYTGKLKGPNIDGHYRFDTRLSYPITETINLNLVGQNLFDRRHQEFTGFSYTSSAEIGRSLFGGVALTF